MEEEDWEWGRSHGQTDGEQEEEGEKGGANSGPPISPDDLGQPQRRAGAGPKAAQTWGGGDRAPVPRGRESESESGSAGSAPRPLCGVRVGGGALSVALKTRRAGGKA